MGCVVGASACLPSPPSPPLPVAAPIGQPATTVPPAAQSPVTTAPAPTTTAPAAPPVCGSPVSGSAVDEGSATTGATGPSGSIDSGEIAAATDVATWSAATSGADGIVLTAVDADGHPEIHRIDAADAASAVTDAQLVEAWVSADGGDVVAIEADRPVTAAVTNDPGRPAQWALTQLNVEGLWPVNNGTGVCVAVIDTGVQSTHPDLAGLVVGTADFTGEGPADGYGHGTHVAGIIGAVANNGVGISGAAPGADVLSVKVLASNGSGLSSWAADGIIWAVDHGATVLNLSLGASCPPAQSGGCMSTAMQTAVSYAQSHDVVVVAAAGNDGDPNGAHAGNWSWPAAYTWPIAVGATTASSTHSSFSTSAPYVDVAAPGSSIYSTYLTTVNGGYAYMSGTSMATPYVTALAALLRGAHPSDTAAQIRARITSTATDLGPPGPDPDFGAGLINPSAATAG